MTIHELLALTGLTGSDEIPVWDAEASGEPTKKITAQNFAAAIKTLASLLGTGDVVNNLTIDDSTGNKVAGQHEVYELSEDIKNLAPKGSKRLIDNASARSRLIHTDYALLYLRQAMTAMQHCMFFQTDIWPR
jgi:hypothetical protein